ncbi:ThuA domain-containing protein [uncultured Draconibacterium sp.]|uniref:ThuA domain-containing protein n=1 Tax=uncultured Draconibacterium sp. TaxID=1573823 RepID=UPI0029C79AFA|nr:ThuA domain-containing protein [uncultured Draconibacterium sp.]
MIIRTIYLLLFSVFLFSACSSTKKAAQKDDMLKYKVLVVNGQNNHNWEIGSSALKQIFEGSGLFTVSVATSPEKGADMNSFKPNFSAYDLIVLDYNGDEWCDETKTNFVDYVNNGGGVFVMHAADNSFPKWPEYNEIIGLGGWGQRNEKDGPYVYYKNGEIVRDNSPGRGGAHGKQHEYLVKTCEPNHPIMKGLPEEWLHAQDELYHGLRGPAKNMTILATAYSAPSTKSKNKFHPTGRDEPALMIINYGKGRVFHTIMGHASEKNQAMKCAGFIVTSLRGAEWAASGKVTQDIPKSHPTKIEVCLWEDYTEN